MGAAFPPLAVAGFDEKRLVVQHELGGVEDDESVLELGVVEETIAKTS